MIRTNGHGAVPTQKRIGLRGGSAQRFEFPPRGQFGGREPRLEHFFFLSEVEVRRFEIYIYVKKFHFDKFHSLRNETFNYITGNSLFARTDF